MTIKFMKIADEYVGRAILVILRMFAGNRETPRMNEPARILVIKFWGIGSVTLSTPLLVKLKERWPRAEIHYLTLNSNAELCSLIDEVDCVHTVSLRSLLSFLLTTIATVWRIRKLHFDIVYDLEFFSNVSSIICFLSGAPERVASLNPRQTISHRPRLYTRTVEFREADHTAANFLRLSGMSGLVRFATFHIREGESRTTDALFPVVLNINASSLAHERRWGADNFRELAERLITVHGASIYLIGSADERGYTNRFHSMFHNSSTVTNLCGELTTNQLIQLIGESNLVVTNDSGPLHIASALNITTISFFGPETPKRYDSLADHHLTFYAGLWCSPCMTVSNLKTVNCINDMQCMKQIRSSDIMDQVDRFLSSIKETISERENRNFIGVTP